MSPYPDKSPKGKQKKQEVPDEGPINNEAERIVLSSMLSNNRIYEEYADQIQAFDFHYPLHQQIFLAIGRLIAKGKRAEPASIMSELTAAVPMADMTTVTYLDQLKFNSRPAEEVAALVDAVKNAAIGRRIREMCARFEAQAKTGTAGLIDKMSHELITISGKNAPDTYGHVADKVDAVLKEINDRRLLGGGLSGIATGFHMLDDLLDGLQKSRMYVIGARPKQGKTALGLCMMRNMLRAGIPIVFFSLEMPKAEIIKRLIALESQSDAAKMVRGKFNDDDALRIEDAAEEVRRWPLHIDDAGTLSPDALALRARHAVRVDGAKAVFIDYLQCLKGSGRGRYEQITDVSQAIASLRKTLDVPIVALAQLNRKLADRVTARDFSQVKPESSRPNDADLKDSGQIEQDADSVIFLNRHEVYLEALRPVDGNVDAEVDWRAAMDKVRGKAELIVHFNRSGPTGIVHLHFDGPVMAFREQIVAPRMSHHDASRQYA